MYPENEEAKAGAPGDANWNILRSVLAESHVPARRKRMSLRWRATLACGLLIVVVALGMVVAHEISDLPEGALAGAALRLQMGITELQSQVAAQLGQGEKPKRNPKPLTETKSTRGRKTAAKAKLGEEAVQNPGNVAEASSGDAITVKQSVAPLRPVSPFSVEVGDSRRRRVLDPKTDDPNKVHLQVTEPEPEPAPAEGAPLNMNLTPHGEYGPVVLRALVRKDGSIEVLWKVSGPSSLTAAAIETVKGSHYPPYYQNGQPVEMETLITVNFLPPNSRT